MVLPPLFFEEVLRGLVLAPVQGDEARPAASREEKVCEPPCDPGAEGTPAPVGLAVVADPAGSGFFRTQREFAMKARFLESARLEDVFTTKCEDKEHVDERDEYLDFYTVPDGKRVRIRPVLPESWHSLNTYLIGIGCPKDVAAAIVAGVQRIVGSKLPSALSARLRDEDSLDIFLGWDGGKYVQLVLVFEDTESSDE